MTRELSRRGGFCSPHIAACVVSSAVAQPGSAASTRAIKRQPEDATSSRIRRRRRSASISCRFDKIQATCRLKAEVYSSGHPGARTMVMGTRHDLMGPQADRPCLCITHKEVKIMPMSHPAQRLAFRMARSYVCHHKVFARQHRGQAGQSWHAGRADREFNLPDTIHTIEVRHFGPDGSSMCRSARTATSGASGQHGQIRRYDADGATWRLSARGSAILSGFHGIR